MNTNTEIEDAKARIARLALNTNQAAEFLSTVMAYSGLAALSAARSVEDLCAVMAAYRPNEFKMRRALKNRRRFPVGHRRRKYWNNVLNRISNSGR
jgi:hypothetical protein